VYESKVLRVVERIALLGWGSLIWDTRFPEFDKYRGPWLADGPRITVEFSRVSESRDGALTLVIDPDHGTACSVQYAWSKRQRLEDAVCDLRCREGTTWKNIGFVLADGSRYQARHEATLDAICEWSRAKGIGAVVWTDLRPNFEDQSGTAFTVDSATRYLQSLDSAGKAKAAEYVWRAPEYVNTPLRRALQTQPWFALEKPS